MDGADTRFPAVTAAVDLAAALKQRRAEIRRPGRVFRLGRGLCAGQRGNGPYGCRHGVQGRHVQAALAGDDAEPAFRREGHGQVARRHHQVAEVRGHLRGSMRQGQEQIDRCARVLRTYGLPPESGPIGFRERKNEGALGGIFAAERAFGFGHPISKFCETLDGTGHPGRGIPGDGVAPRAAGDLGQADVVPGRHIGQDACQQLEGVGAVPVNVNAGVPAAQAADGKAHKPVFIRDGGKPQVAGDGHIPAPGAADREHPLGFGIQVDQRPPLEEAGLQFFCAGQAGLLVHREEQFYCRAGQAFVFGERQPQGEGHPVVGAQRGLIRVDPVAVADDADGVPGEVVRRCGGLLAHHVQVPLDHHCRRRLSARCRRHGDQQVAGPVPAARKVFRAGPGLEPTGKGVLVFRAAGDAVDLPKDLQKPAGLGVHDVGSPVRCRQEPTARGGVICGVNRESERIPRRLLQGSSIVPGMGTRCGPLMKRSRRCVKPGARTAPARGSRRLHPEAGR